MTGPEAHQDLQKRFWERDGLKQRRGPAHPSVEAYVWPRVERVRKATGIGAEGRLLDVGCGDGRFTFHFGKVCKATGVDFSEALVARSLCPDVRRMSAENLEFPDGSFDVAFEHALLHHVDDPGRVVAEMSRVSRRWVVLCEPNRANPLMFAYHALVPAERGGLRMSMRHLRGLAERAGLRVASAATHGLSSANWTPAFLAPLAARFEADQPLGVSHLLVAEKIAENRRGP